MKSKYYLSLAVAFAGHRVAESPLAGGRSPRRGCWFAGRRPLLLAAPRHAAGPPPLGSTGIELGLPPPARLSLLS
jgi:hypothetical protein